MNVEQIAVADLIPYVRNARTHSDAQVAQIAASIREFGFNNQIIVNEIDAKNFGGISLSVSSSGIRFYDVGLLPHRSGDT